jgi:hypothetical protein
MENEKERYFAAHWGQEVAMVAWPPKGTKIVPLDDTVYSFLGLPVIHCADYLELTSLSDITDEDAIEVGLIHHPRKKPLPHHKTVGRRLVNEFLSGVYNLRLDEADYLRSKSYALPFNGKSVEKLIELGWLRVTKE